MNQKYLNDQWTLEDDLGIAGTGDLLARMALEVQPPFSVRVTGKWGSGKTSVLRRAFATLGGQPIQQAVPLGQNVKETGSAEWEKWIYDSEKGRRQEVLQWPADLYAIAEQSLCVWYSPWQHQGTDNPLIPLLLEIQAQFSTRIRMKKKLLDINRRGGLAALALIEQVIDVAASLTFQKNVKLAQGTTDRVRKAWKEAEPNLTGLSDGQRFHLLFEDAVKNILLSLSKKKKIELLEDERLIVFIDDLDRCEESVVVNLLEYIKLYLGSPHCVFVLGIDDNAVLGAMKRTWDGRSDEDNREYLEKMFQATLAVPLPRPDRIQAGIRAQLKAHKFPDDKDEQGHDCAAIIEKLLEPNPRKIKNFCNSLCASWNQFRGYENESENYARKFILFHYLRLFHRPVWRLLERQPRTLPLLHRVLTNSPDPVAIENFDEESQRLLKELFERAFSHVLMDNTANKSDEDLIKYHRSMDLDQAMQLFQERLDSKRSDEFFIKLFKSLLVDENEELGEDFLCLPGLKPDEAKAEPEQASSPD
ncbi:hypothetical protein DENIS_1217 [Desulfonema ishimotonii]|uniref:KAP NTPase domain-containing protein n=1 Tax=Desulfonema ishimotonii TaxID=45657 RepID=A0A401FTH5_9BACT|nr:P-loop NTPase fold protein [Desulfonema ishimotonii]GBC60266.1 hypothetical protein DENIS_1217 [Desulfonema ishimotonii]